MEAYIALVAANREVYNVSGKLERWRSGWNWPRITGVDATPQPTNRYAPCRRQWLVGDNAGLRRQTGWSNPGEEKQS